MHVDARLKYMLKAAGEIKINGRLVKAARRKRHPTAKKMDIQT